MKYKILNLSDILERIHIYVIIMRDDSAVVSALDFRA